MTDVEIPYSEKVYNALKQKVNGFDLSPEDFYTKLNDPKYQTNVYNALKSKVTGFDIPETEFYDRLKKKDQTDSTPSFIAAPPEQKISTPPTFDGQNLVPGTPQPVQGGEMLPSGLTEDQDKQNSLESLRKDWDQLTGGNHRPIEELNVDPLREAIYAQPGEVGKTGGFLYDIGKKALSMIKHDFPAMYHENRAADKYDTEEDFKAHLQLNGDKNKLLKTELLPNGEADVSLDKTKPEFQAEYDKFKNSSLEERKQHLAKAQALHEESTKFLAGVPQTWDEAKKSENGIVSYIGIALGQAVAQVPVGMATMGASSFYMERGDAYHEAVDAIAKENKISPQEVLDKGMDEPARKIGDIVGLINGTLDAVSLGGVLSTFKGAAKKVVLDAAKKGIQESVLKYGLKKGAEVGVTTIGEVGTEWMQEMDTQVGALIAKGKTLDQINFDDISKGGDIDYSRNNEVARQALFATGPITVAGAVSQNKIQPKSKENAIRERIPEKVHVGETSGNSQKVGERVSGTGTEESPNAQGGQKPSEQVESKIPSTEEKKVEEKPTETPKQEANGNIPLQEKVDETGRGRPLPEGGGENRTEGGTKPKVSSSDNGKRGKKKIRESKVPKPIEKTIVAKEIEKQIGETEDEIKTAQTAFEDKAKELDKTLTADQENLFGERDSQKDQGLFDIRAKPEEREKILEPFKARIAQAKEKLASLNEKLKEESGKKDTTLFDDEVSQLDNAHEVAKQYDEEVRNPSVDAKDVSIAEALKSTKVNQESVLRYGDKKTIGQSMAKSYIRSNAQGLDNIARSANEHMTGKPEGPITEEDVWQFMQTYPNGATTLSTPSGNPKLAALANRYAELTGTAINRKTARTIVERVGKKYAKSPEHFKAIESRFSSFITEDGKFNAARAAEAFEKSPEWIKSTYDLTDQEFEDIKAELNEKAKKQGTPVQQTESESTEGNGTPGESRGETPQETGHQTEQESEPDWVTGEPMSRMAQAQFTGQRADGRTAKQVEVASRKIGRSALDAINRRLLAKFPGIKGVITNKEKVQQAWNDYLTHGGGIFMSFANENSKLNTEMRTKLDRAEKLSVQGVKPYDIWRNTGWFKYKDGKWRYEIDSSKAKLVLSDDHMDAAWNNTSPSIKTDLIKVNPKYSLPLEKVLSYDEFQKIEPESKNMMVRFFKTEDESAPELKGLRAAYMLSTNSIFVNLNLFGYHTLNESKDGKESRRNALLSTLLHELQHDLQFRGGLSVGQGFHPTVKRLSQETGLPIYSPTVRQRAFDEYYNHYAEIEARKAQERQDYNDWQRTHIEPFTRKELPEFYAQNTGEELPNGFIYGDNIYINPDQARMDTPIHEFGHLWWNVVKQRYPVLYQAGQHLAKNSVYHKEILANPAYFSLSDSMKLDEAIVQAIGEKGALYANKSAWNRFWSDLWSKIRQFLGIKDNVDLGKMSLNDLVTMAGKELLTPGEIGHLSSLHMPETATLRLKEFKLPQDAWADWNKRVQLETIVNSPKSTEWEKAVHSAASQRASAFMRGVQDNTRPMMEIQHEIVNDFIAKQKEVIDNDKSLDKKQKAQAKAALDKNRHQISEKLIGDAKDVHGLMDLMSGKAEAEIKRMHNWLYGKATTEKGYGGVMEFLTKDTDLRGRERVDQDSFAARVQKEGLTLLDVGFYGYVMHAEERNAHKAKISEGETIHGSGMTDDEAKFFKDEIKNSGKAEVLEKFFREAHDKLVQEPLSLRLQEGIINEKDYHVLKNFYGQYYVPLNVEEFASKTGSTGGLSTGLWGTGIKKAKGSDKYRYWQRVNPMVQLIKNYEKTIADIETNKVYKSLLKLAKDSPNDKVWDIIRPKVVVTPEINPETGDIDYKVDKFNSAAEERAMMKESVRVRVNGKQVFIHLKDPELRSMFLDKKANKPSNRFLVDLIRTVNNIQTYQRLTYIGLNIDFPFSNIQRDFQDALVNLQQHEIPGISRKILTDVPRAMVAIMKEEIGKPSDPNISMMRHYMEEMEAQGGMISWLDMGGTKEIRTDIEKEIHRFQDLSKKFKVGEMLLTPTRKLMRAVVVYNKMMEGAIRLSTYANLREAGVSEHKAAKASKNVTVNFNKKGSWGNAINLLYLFGNAGIQGATMFTTSVIKSRKVRAMVLGAILAQIAMRTLLDSLADDDDDIKKLLNENDHNKNWIFVWPHSKGKLITIPVSYNMKPYKAIADGLYDLKKGTKDVSETSLYILKNAINSLVPMTESHLYPTITVPIVEPIQNESMFSGRMIAPEKKTIGQRDSDLYWPRTSKPFVNLAKGMSNLVEGNDDILEVSPAVMEYEFDYLMGGMKSYYKLGENIIDVANGMPTDWNKIPVLRRNVLDLSTQDWRGTTKMREYFSAFQKKRITQDQFDTYLQLRKELIESGAINYKKYSPKLIIRLQFKDFSNPLYVDPKFTPKGKETEDDLY